jgi:hypothetical protein
LSTSRPTDIRGRRWAAVVLGVALLGFGYTLCRRGIVLSDEGYLLLQSWDMTQGKILYRDMDSFVAPGVWFLLSALFRVFGPSVFVSRMAALACYVATVLVSASIVLRLSGPRAALGAVAGFLVVSVWGFPAWTWSFYSIYAVLFALAALERLLAWRESRAGRDLVWVGLFLGLAVTFKQNYGAQALVGALLGAAAIRLEAERSFRALLRAAPAAAGQVALGMAAVALPLLAYFAFYGALPDLFEALVVHPFTSFLGQHNIPYLPASEFLQRDLMGGFGRLTYGAYGLSHGDMRWEWPPLAVRGVELLHVLLYWIPPAVFATGTGLALLSLRRGGLDGGLAAVLAVCGLLFLGVFPRADLNHLMNVYQPVIVVTAVVLERLARRGAAVPRALRSAGLGLGGALFAVYAGIAVYWFVDLRTLLSTELEQPRGHVLLSRESRDMIDFEVEQIRRRSHPGEAVLTLPALSMLNFLAERPVPSRYYNHYAVHIGDDAGEGVVQGLEASGTRLVLADYYGFFSQTVGLREYAPRLTDYLRRYFQPVLSVAIDDHMLLMRRKQPLPERRLLNVLDDCDVGFHDWRSRGIQRHLLFDMLYHPLQSGTLVVRRQAETQCRVSLPEDATLAFAVGYRQPTRAARGTELVAEIWVRPAVEASGGYERVFRDVLPVRPLGGWSSPPHAEHRLDLSHWGGQDVWILFRTLYEGDTRMNLLDFKGFAMVWQDPQIEYDGRPDTTAGPVHGHPRPGL